MELNNKYNKQELHELHMNYALSCMHGVQKKFLKDAEIQEKKTLILKLILKKMFEIYICI